jgi:hypothetical protein
VAHHVQEVACPHHVRAGHQRSLLGTGRGQHQAGGDAARLQGQAGRQRAAHRPQFAGQGQLAGEFVARQPGGVDLSAGGQDAQGDRQVEAPRVLGRSAGARLTVILLLWGNSRPALSRAERTRSRASFTSVSTSPTSMKVGRPLARCTSTVTAAASSPTRARLCTKHRLTDRSSLSGAWRLPARKSPIAHRDGANPHARGQTVQRARHAARTRSRATGGWHASC